MTTTAIKILTEFKKCLEINTERSKKPRVRFCWECGKQLYGNHHEEVKLPHDDLYVIMHKQCAKEFKKINAQ